MGLCFIVFFLVTPKDLFDDFGRILGKLEIKIISALDVKNTDMIGKSDPFVECYLSSDPSNKLKTKAI
jgi:hypothetical protein